MCVTSGRRCRIVILERASESADRTLVVPQPRRCVEAMRSVGKNALTTRRFAARRAAATLSLLALLVTGVVGPVGASRRPRLADSSANSARPRGLVQPGNSKTRCIYVGLGAPLQMAEKATHVVFNCLETFSDANPTWSAWVDPWLTHTQYGYKQWLADDPTRRTVILTQDLIPDSEAADLSWRAKGAAGDFNQYAKQLAKNLVSAGFGYSVIRLGHEMNGTWVRDNVGTTRTQWREWAEFFAQTVRAMRTVPGAHFLFDWDVNAGVRPIPLSDYYPGNLYVDIVGIDFYDSGGGNAVPTAAAASKRWSVLTQQSSGLDQLYQFAYLRGKPLSVPEWGTVTRKDMSTAGGDDGAYVTYMGQFFATHDIAYESWFDADSDGIYELNARTAPKSVAAYVKTISRV